MTRWLVALGVLVATVLGLEGVARVFLRTHWNTSDLQEQLGRRSIKSLIEFDGNPAVMYRLRRDLDTEFMESRVVTDDAGVRVASRDVAARDGGIRIAMFGDSTPFGWRVPYAESYGEKLRAELESATHAAVVLRNFSVPGYNAAQELEVLRPALASFRPNLVILHHDHNDWQPTGFGYGGWLPPEYGDNALHSALLKLVLRQIKKGRDKRIPVPEKTDGEFVGEYCAGGPRYEAMMEIRRAFLEAARAEGVPVLVVIFDSDAPADEHYETSERYVRLHKQAADRFQAMGYLVFDI